MPEQFSLMGTDPPPKLTDRLFFGIYPDAAVAAQIAQLAQRLRGEHGLKGKPLQIKHFHVTLHLVGDYAGLRPEIVRQALEAAAAVAMPPFRVAFDRVMSFSTRLGNRPL